MVIQAERKKIADKELKKITALFREKLKQEGVPFKKIILFGSYARGKATIDSDIDLAVVVPAPLEASMRQKMRQIAWWAKQTHIKLEPHILTVADFNNPWLSFAAEIKKSGIVICDIKRKNKMIKF